MAFFTQTIFPLFSSHVTHAAPLYEVYYTRKLEAISYKRISRLTCLGYRCKIKKWGTSNNFLPPLTLSLFRDTFIYIVYTSLTKSLLFLVLIKSIKETWTLYILQDWLSYYFAGCWRRDHLDLLELFPKNSLRGEISIEL